MIQRPVGLFKMIKLSDYIVSFLENQGVKDIFLLSGGGCIHLVDSIGKSKKIRYYCCLHEQAVAMSTEAYARVKEDLGVSLVTSGPGGTNAITGVAGSWMDSVPHLILSGQTFLKQTIGHAFLKPTIENLKLRQLGIQEINIIDIVKPITKYAVMIDDPKKIKYHLQKAIYLAKTGRPGPVWLDIPANIQMTMINENELEEFNPNEIDIELDSKEIIKKKVVNTVELLKSSKRPVIYVGHGVKISKAVSELIELIEKSRLPLLTARNANDIIASDHELFIGRPGIFGDRGGNFTIQNSDLLIVIGARLCLAQTGYDYKNYAKNAKLVMVDVDKAELEKYTVSPDIAINCYAKEFITELKRELSAISVDVSDWLQQCIYWKKKYPVILLEYKNQKKFVNSYYFIDVLSQILNEKDVIVTDMGFAFQNTHQAFKVKKGQKLFTSSGLAAMGYGLPAAIGSCIANNKKRVICISGDGGLQLNIQELQTIVHNNLPVKLFVFSNQGYSTIKKTQYQNFNGRYNACDKSTGLSFPDIIKVADAYGIKSKRIDTQKDLHSKIKQLIEYDGPIVCEIVMDPIQRQMPMASPKKREDGTFEKKPIEDMFPYLDREEFKKNML